MMSAIASVATFHWMMLRRQFVDLRQLFCANIQQLKVNFALDMQASKQASKTVFEAF